MTDWATGDVDALETLLNESMRVEAPEAYEVLIVQRNANWISQIAEIMDGEGTVFIAVGAAHLPGEDGVIHLLRNEGFTVTRQ